MTKSAGMYKVKVDAVELHALREFLDSNPTIAKATQEYEREMRWKEKCQDLYP